MTGFKLQHLHKKFENLEVLTDLNLDIAEASFVAVVGASGSGKSTLLRLIAGLEKPTQGKIQWERPLRQAFVFQDSNLLPWRTVEENIALPFEIDPHLKKATSRSSSNKTARILSCLQQVHLQNFSKKFPHQLSGGMKMRAALARALVSDPELLLLDEPFSALDEITRQDLQIQLHSLSQQRSQSMAVMLVTHQIPEAVFLAQRVVVIGKSGIRLDLPIPLPDVRTQSTRNLPLFHELVQKIYEALL